jgi:hypothetical protein
MPSRIWLGKLLDRLASSRTRPASLGRFSVGSMGRLSSRWAVFHSRTPRQSAGTLLAKALTESTFSDFGKIASLIRWAVQLCKSYR